MQDNLKELTPVKYGPSAIKSLVFNVEANTLCFRLHWHERMELIRLKSGSLKIGYAENEIILKKDEVYIIPPKIPHTATAVTNTEYDVIMFDVRSFYNDTALCLSFLEPLFEGRAKFAIKTDNAKILFCFDRIMQLIEENTLETTAQLYNIISLLYENCLTNFCVNKNDTVTSRAVKYIEENFSQDITTKSIAKQFGYSSEHFCRKFKDETKLTPMNYLKIHRLENSAKLLKNGNLNIREIALKCGFDDSNYFTRCFKAHFGVPPTKYRD